MKSYEYVISEISDLISYFRIINWKLYGFWYEENFFSFNEIEKYFIFL